VASSQNKVPGEVAGAALSAFIVQTLAFIVPGRHNTIPEWVASGTFFATPAGRVVVLTAKHNLTRADREPLRLGYFRCTNVLDDIAEALAMHPDPGIDVGLVALKRAASDAVASHVLPVSLIAEADDIAPEDALIVGGFPSRLTRGRETERLNMLPLLNLGFMSVTYGTALQEPPMDERGLFRVAWTEMEILGSAPIKMPHPEGISGGGLWRFRGVGKGNVWLPQKSGRLVGVPVSFLETSGTAFAEPASRWRRWFTNTLAELDDIVPFR
jgi:hypothetical protein